MTKTSRKHSRRFIIRGTVLHGFNFLLQDLLRSGFSPRGIQQLEQHFDSFAADRKSELIQTPRSAKSWVQFNDRIFYWAACNWHSLAIHKLVKLIQKVCRNFLWAVSDFNCNIFCLRALLN